ncbi:MAG: lysophospholipid acyltransferase family protein [Anaerolineaceae bacterium]|nr:lysophospholipid acyltransferase family protein [Anaerolineaceae bacterium]
MPKGAVILAANHPCTVDPAMLTLLTHRQVSILILDTLFKVPLFGASLKFSGHIPVVCGQGQAALNEAERLVRAGRSVVIFPEGEISPPDGGYCKPRSGLARLALITGAPIVPVGIHLDPRQIRVIETQVGHKPEIGTWYLSGPYGMTVGEPMLFKGGVEDREYVKRVSEQVMNRIARLSDESALRIQTADRLYWQRPASSLALWKIPLVFFRNVLGFEGVI